MNNNVELVSPWIDYYRKVEALFRRDPEIDIRMEENEEFYAIILTVDGSKSKVEALRKLLPSEDVTFGGVKVRVSVYQAEPEFNSNLDILRAAFDGNPAFAYAANGYVGFNEATFGVFNKEVVQYQNDSLSDINHMASTLYENVARDVLDDLPGVFYSTSITDPGAYNFRGRGNRRANIVREEDF